MFTYIDEFIDDQWEKYENYLYDYSLEDSDQNRHDFADLKIDDYLAFVKESGEQEYTGDEGDYDEVF